MTESPNLTCFEVNISSTVISVRREKASPSNLVPDVQSRVRMIKLIWSTSFDTFSEAKFEFHT